jgi:hypothetical protein
MDMNLSVNLLFLFWGSRRNKAVVSKEKRKRRNKAKLCSLAQPAVLCSLRPIIYVAFNFYATSLT